MARLKNTKFTVESFKEQAKWIGKLLGPLNTLMNDLLFALNGNLTMENLSQEIKTVRFVNKEANLPVVFQQRFNRRVAGVNIINCYDHTNETQVSITPMPVWTSSRQQITLSSISGLTDGNDYSIKVHVIYEG